MNYGVGSITLRIYKNDKATANRPVDKPSVGAATVENAESELSAEQACSDTGSVAYTTELLGDFFEQALITGPSEDSAMSDEDLDITVILKEDGERRPN